MNTTDMKQLINFKVTSPIQIEFTDMEMKKMNVLTGHNGAGKSLFNKLIWLVAMIKNYYILAKYGELGENEWNDEINYIIADTIDNLTCEYKENTTEETFEVFGYKTEIVIKDSKLEKIEMKSTIELKELITNPLYASTNTRSMNTLKVFNNLKKSLLNKNKIETFDELKKINQCGFKIYDIMYLEQITDKMKRISELTKMMNVKELLGVDDLYYDESIDEIVLKIDNKKIPITNAGNGHQAMISMLLAVI